MKVKLLQRSAGPHGNWPPGRIIDVDKAEVDDLIQRGQAVKASAADEKAFRVLMLRIEAGSKKE